MTDNKDRLVQLWISHNDFFWQQVRAIPFIEAVILAGAYKLYVDSECMLALAILGLGLLFFVLIGLMINRHRQHAKKFRDEAGDAIPDPGLIFPWIRSDWIAVSIPFFLALFNAFGMYLLWNIGT